MIDSRPWTRPAAMALILAPALVALLFIRTYAVNVPYWDEWAIVHDLGDQLRGHLQFAELWHQHNEHRILFPKLLMIAIARATSFNTRATMQASWLLLVLSAALLLADHLRGRGRSLAALLEFIPVAWLLFSLRQWENLLWGWQITIFLCAAGLIAALYALRRAEHPAWLGAAIACGVVCSYSFANGLIVWPAGVVRLLTGQPRHRARSAWIWTAAGACTTALYLIGWQRPAYHPSPAYLLEAPSKSLQYLLGSVGGALFPDLWSAIGAGLVILGVVAGLVMLWRSGNTLLPDSMAPALVAFSLCSSALLTVGRAGFGPGQALSSRYATFTLLGLIGAYLVAVSNLHAHRAVPWLAGALLSLAVVGRTSGDGDAVSAAKALRAQRQLASRVLLHYRTAPDQGVKELLYPDVPLLRERAAVLEQYRLGPFSPAAAAPGASGTEFYVDVINGGPASEPPPIVAGGDLVILGWAVDDEAQSPAAGVMVVVDGRQSFAATYGGPRPDVAAALGSTAYVNTAFHAVVPTADLAIGAHSLSLRILKVDGKGAYEPPARWSFEIR